MMWKGFLAICLMSALTAGITIEERLLQMEKQIAFLVAENTLMKVSLEEMENEKNQLKSRVMDLEQFVVSRKGETSKSSENQHSAEGDSANTDFDQLQILSDYEGNTTTPCNLGPQKRT